MVTLQLKIRVISLFFSVQYIYKKIQKYAKVLINMIANAL